MAFPPAFLDDVRARVPLADVVAKSVKLQRRGREFTGLCPFHREKTPSFTVVEDKGFFHCFGCGAHGNVFDFLMRVENLAFPEAVERLATAAGLPMPRPDRRQSEHARRLATLYDVLEEACLWFQRQLDAPDGAAARTYLRRRSVARETAERFRLGYAPDGRRPLIRHLTARGVAEAAIAEAGLASGEGADRFRHRLIFPIGDAGGRIVAFGGRAMGDHPAKYLNSPEGPLFHKGRLLYGYAQARRPARAAGTAIVVEGYMDVISLSQAGFRHAVAPLGTALTEGQLGLLWRLADEPLLCFDGDGAGRRAALRTIDRALPGIAPGRSLNFVQLPDGLDPDDLVRTRGKAAMAAALRHRVTLFDMLWKSNTENGRFDTPERRAGLERALMERIERIGERSVQRRYRDAVKERLWRAFSGGRRVGGRAEAALEARPSPQQGGSGREEAERLLLARPLGHEELLERVADRLAEIDFASAREEAERLLLALPLDHEELLERVADRLAEIDFATPGAARLRDLMLDALADEENLDSAALQRHLEAGDRSALPPWFARRAATEPPRRAGTRERVERLWQHALDLHGRCALEDEIAAGAAAWPQDADEEGWRRLRAMLALRQDSRAPGSAARETGEA